MSPPRMFTNKEIKSLHAALKALDGRSDQGKYTAYDMDVQTRWNVAENLAILQRHIEVLESVTGSLLEANGLVEGEQVTEANHSRIMKFSTELKAVLGKEVEVVGLAPLNKDRLRKLPIPPSVISALLPLITES